MVEGKGREVERNLVARRHDNPNGAAAGAVNVIGIRPVAIVGVAAVHAVQRLIAQRRVVGHSKASVLALQPSISQLAVGKHLVVIADALSGRRRGVGAKGETNLLGCDNLHRAGGGAQRDRPANHSVIAVVSLLHQLHEVAAAAVQVQLLEDQHHRFLVVRRTGAQRPGALLRGAVATGGVARRGELLFVVFGVEEPCN